MYVDPEYLGDVNEFALENGYDLFDEATQRSEYFSEYYEEALSAAEEFPVQETGEFYEGSENYESDEVMGWL